MKKVSALAAGSIVCLFALAIGAQETKNRSAAATGSFKYPGQPCSPAANRPRG